MNRADYDALLGVIDNDGPTPPLANVRAAIAFDPKFPDYLSRRQLVELLDEAIRRLDEETEVFLIRRDPPPDGRMPPGRNRTKELDRIALEVRKTPGEWFLVEENVYPGNTNKYHSRGLQTRMSKVPGSTDQRFNIYIRYQPGEPGGPDRKRKRR